MAAHFYETLYQSVIVYGVDGSTNWLQVHRQEFAVFGATEVRRVHDLVIRVDFPSAELGIQFKNWMTEWSYLGLLVSVEFDRAHIREILPPQFSANFRPATDQRQLLVFRRVLTTDSRELERNGDYPIMAQQQPAEDLLRQVVEVAMVPSAPPNSLPPSPLFDEVPSPLHFKLNF